MNRFRQLLIQLLVLVVSGDDACDFGSDGDVCKPAEGSALLHVKSVKQRVAIAVKDELVPRPTPASKGSASVPLRAWLPEFRKLRDGKQAQERTRQASLLAYESERSKLNVSTMRAATSAEKEAFLEMHNLYRCMHGVPKVVWNDDVAADANNYISPMTQMVHAASYNIPAPAGPAGENLAWSSAHLCAADAVTMWYDEVNYCKGGPKHFTDGCADDEHGVTGHFTAMIWEGVKEIGCAFSDSTGPTVIICRYKAGDSLSLDTPNMNHPDNYPNHVHPQIKEEKECLGVPELEGAESATVFVKHPNSGLSGTEMSLLQTSGGFHGSESECLHKCVELACAGFTRAVDEHCEFFSEVVLVTTSSEGVDAYVKADEPATVPGVTVTVAPAVPDVTEPLVEPPPIEEEIHEPAGSSCQGDSSKFSAGYGPCSTYAAGKGNHGYCDMDRDKMSQLLASEVCEECGKCGAGAGTETETVPAAKGSAGYDGPWADPTKCKYADPNWHCEGYQCVPKDQYQWYSAAGGAWCLSNASPLCQQPDHSWCDGQCSCPGMCQHACGRCPP